MPRKMVSNKEHSIHQLLLPAKNFSMILRDSDCTFALPDFCLATVPFNPHKRRSFVLQSLFENGY